MDSGEGDGGLELSIVLGEGLEAPNRCGESETMPERPESLFKDWAMEVCIKSSSKIIGVRDQYYYDLMSHHHFRSKKDVEYFLLTGMIRRYTPKSKKPTTNKRSELRKDARVDMEFMGGHNGRLCMNFSSDGGDSKTQILK
ncbi:hypothetical protein MRB53_030115 [Persea americana]|uniref:Uncharacterized protein n=1 Tax=Persea americana TaxID=3435 RepID=A0ACC2KKF3_PERAE|nr:hypothetical protein MRB53_030115 [Persea americana]